MGWRLLWLYHRFRFALLVTGILLENPFGYYAGRMLIFLLTLSLTRLINSFRLQIKAVLVRLSSNFSKQERLFRFLDIVMYFDRYKSSRHETHTKYSLILFCTINFL